VVAAGAGAAALVLALLVPRRGPGLGVLAAAVAGVVGVLGLLVVGIDAFGGFTPVLLESLLIPLGLVLAVQLKASAAGALVVPSTRTSGLALVLGALVTVLAGIGVLSTPSVIAPWAATATVEGDASEQAEADIEVAAWLSGTEPDASGGSVTRRRRPVGWPPTGAATRGPPRPACSTGRLQTCRRCGTSWQVRDPQLRGVHGQLIDLVATKRLQVVAVADFVRSGDDDDVDRLRALQEREREQTADLEAGITALLQRVEESLDDRSRFSAAF
jgi:hypothetical protein